MLLQNVKRESRDLIFVYTTCPSKEEARSIGLQVINEKLIISADYWLIESIYPWKGVIQEVGQYMLMVTSQRRLGDKLIKFIDKIHSYNTPMIAVCNASEVNYPFKFWMDGLLVNKNKYITEEEAKIKEVEDEEGVYHYGKLK